jgi:hypothetical protein
VRRLFSFSLGVALVASAFAAAPTSASAATVLHKGGDCGMLGADARGSFAFGGIGTVTHVVQNGNHVILKCKGTDIMNDSGRAQTFSGFECGVPFPEGGFDSTDNSHATVSKSGNATLTCKLTFVD